MTAGPTPSVVRVRLFAGLRERAGWGERLVPLPEGGGCTPAALWRQLQLGTAWGAASGAEATPALPAGLRVAINQVFAAADTPLRDGDELGFLPPISGG